MFFGTAFFVSTWYFESTQESFDRGVTSGGTLRSAESTCPRYTVAVPVTRLVLEDPCHCRERRERQPTQVGAATRTAADGVEPLWMTRDYGSRPLFSQN